jgi:hypothetical protein
MIDEAADALWIEGLSLSLNPRMPLYSGRTLRSVLEKAENTAAIERYEDRLASVTYGVYRVRRIYWAKGRADRKVEKIFEGPRVAATARLGALAAERGADVIEEGGADRVYVTRLDESSYPAIEEQYVTAPASIEDKYRKSFERSWDRVHADAAAAQ